MPRSDWLQLGVTVAEFRARYFERNFLLVRNGVRELTFTWQEVQSLLQHCTPTPPRLQVFKDGAVDPTCYLSQLERSDRHDYRLNASAFDGLLRSGATAVLNQVEAQLPLAQRLCRRFGRLAQSPAMANAYLSFGGCGTFGKHWDTHDVFVVQVLGSKHWRIYAPTWTLPLSHQTSQHYGDARPGQLVFEGELQAGDVLYLPRGWWHEATPLEAGSFHLSIGTYAPTAVEFMQWLCQRQLALEPAARVGLLPSQAGVQPGQSLDPEVLCRRLAQVMRDPGERSLFHRSQAIDEALQPQLDLDVHARGLSGKTLVYLNSSYPLVFDGSHLLVNGVALKLESLRRWVVEQLNNVPTLTVDALRAQRPDVSMAALHDALLDLARHGVVTVDG